MYAILAILDDFQHLATIEHKRIPKRYWYMMVYVVKGYNICQYLFGIQLCSKLPKCWKLSKMQKITYLHLFLQV